MRPEDRVQTLQERGGETRARLRGKRMYTVHITEGKYNSLYRAGVHISILYTRKFIDLWNWN